MTSLKYILSASCLCFAQLGFSQSGNKLNDAGVQNQALSTAVPFLNISPEARSGGMGDVGVALSPDANASYWNASRLAFAEKDYGFALSYTPWLRKLINDMSLSYLSGYYKIRKQEAISVSLTYFNLGEIQFTDQNGQPLQVFRPNEFALSTAYARQLSKTFSMSVGLKFFHSNLAGNVTLPQSGTVAKAVNSVAGDVTMYYQSPKKRIAGGKEFRWGWGTALTNIGPKVTYTDTENEDFIPTNLRFGGSGTIDIDPWNSFTLALDINKLLVPTPPVYDTSGAIIAGNDPSTISPIQGMFTSFADAPGGFKEEMQEYIIAVGAEYWYTDLFAVRAGYHYENPNKGGRTYFNLGLGLRYNSFGLDFAYLIPVAQANPLAETLRFTLHFNFDRKTVDKGVNEE